MVNFYVAQGLLIHRGIRPSSHSGVIGQYGPHFAKTEVLERRFGRLLDRAFARCPARGSVASQANAMRSGSRGQVLIGVVSQGSERMFG